LPVQPDRRVEQTVAHNALAFVPEQPAAADIQMRLKVSEVEALAAGRAAQRHHVPVEQPRIAFKSMRC
jgi:hypothetical protein